jgi:phospholipid/cholesterol/gamma-HCH transport system permease protein
MIRAPMALGKLEQLGQKTFDTLAMFGDFFTFAGATIMWTFIGGLKWKNFRLVLAQIYEVGVRSAPVICITGAFIGMVMAIELYSSFASIGQQEELGVAITLAVVKQIGPVLTAVMLAGRVGGALAAELGTMNVTEQLDALRVMGSDPIQYLVVPRVIACIFLTPILTIYSDVCGILGGWFIAVYVLHIANYPYWNHMISNVEMWQVMEGLYKSLAFGAVIGLISCYKGFTSGAGASGVGRACTESFVSSFISIIILNFVFAQVLKNIYNALYGTRGFSL